MSLNPNRARHEIWFDSAVAHNERMLERKMDSFITHLLRVEDGDRQYSVFATSREDAKQRL